jgi:primosomal protein N' (replication factor Y)
VVAQARRPEIATGFLEGCRGVLVAAADSAGSASAVTVCDPVPMPLARLRGLSRSQLLIEAGRRPALHRLLDQTVDRLGALAAEVGSGLGWSLIVDPLEI